MCFFTNPADIGYNQKKGRKNGEQKMSKFTTRVMNHFFRNQNAPFRGKYRCARDEKAIAQFMEYASGRLRDWGLEDTKLVNPSGLTFESVTTPRDLCMLSQRMCGDVGTMEIWSAERGSFRVDGPEARTVAVVSNVIPAMSASPYRLLGGKGGTYYYRKSDPDTYRKALSAAYEVCGQRVCVGLMSMGIRCFERLPDCARELCAMVEAKMAGKIPEEGEALRALVADGGGYASDAGICRNERARCTAASTTKIVTMLCAQELLTNPDTKVRIRYSDILPYSSTRFYVGDVLRLEDAIRIMMLESNNTLANAVARTAGKRCPEDLKKRGTNR